MGDGTNAEGVKEEAKEEDDAFVNPLDMDVEDDEDLLVCCQLHAYGEVNELTR